MAKSMQNLDVNIVLSKYEFIDVALIESTYSSWAYRNQCFSMYVSEVFSKNAILSKYAAGRTQYFEGIQHLQWQMCNL